MFARKTLFILLLTFFICQDSFSQLSGTYTVGILGGEDFSSLTNTGGAFQAINTFGLSGSVTLEITSDLTAESGDFPLNQWLSILNTVKIVPSTASLKTITHSGCTNHLILLNGADKVTIDGRFASTGSDRYLRFESPCSAKSAIRLEGDCQDVTIRNCIIASDDSQSSQSEGGAIHVHDDQLGGSDNLTISYNLIEDFTAPIDLFDAVQVNAPDAAGGVLDGLVINNNEIRNANGKAIYLIDRAGEINSSQILRNSIYADGVITGPGTGWAFAPIQIESGSGHNIRANWIGGTGPGCTGGKMDVTMGAGTVSAQIIRMKLELPNAAVNNIDSNVVKNIEFVGNSSNSLSVIVISIESGNCNVGVNNGNVIGDVSVDASTVASSSISLTENTNSTSNKFRGIDTDSDGTVVISNNQIGGILLNDNGGNDIVSYLIYSNGSSATITNNQIGGVSNNIVKRANDDIRAIYSNGDDAPINIQGNVIQGITTYSEFDADFYGIRIRGGNGVPTILNNTIQNCNIGDLNYDARIYGIRNENPNALLDGNTIDNIQLSSGRSGTQFYGIYVIGDGSTFNVQENTVSNISLTNTASLQTNAMGIYTTGVSTFNLFRNLVANIESQSGSNSTYIRGINTNSSIQNNLVNNVVLLSNGSNTNDIYLYGIYSNVSSGSGNIWHNTVDIRGTASGSRRSSCLYKTGGADRNVQSNIFNNKRIGGFGGHYAVYNSSTSGSLVYNYNLLHVDEDLGKLVRHGGDNDFVTWQGLGFGVNSVSPLTTYDLVNSATGQQLTDLGNDIANPGLGVSDDHVLASRPQDFGPDMGAFEIPNILVQSWVLPIQIADFSIDCNSFGVQLNWQTKSEVNNDYFVIESSKNGENWTVEGVVDGAGNSSKTIKYSYNVTSIDNYDKYYRLTQVDFNGEHEIFDIERANCYNNISCEDSFVWFDSKNNILIFDEECFKADFKFHIFDRAGRLILSAKSQSNQYPVSLPPGVYLITASQGSKVQSCKIILYSK